MMQLGETTAKYDIPISHLDYKYIDSCEDVVELEKILKILRSGDEGCFPQMETACEEKIRSINPESRVLRKDEKLIHTNWLPDEERQEVEKELDSWLESVGHATMNNGKADKSAPKKRAKHPIYPTAFPSNGGSGDATSPAPDPVIEGNFDPEGDLPAVRSPITLAASSNKATVNGGSAIAQVATSNSTTKKKNPLPRSYKDWSKLEKLIDEEEAAEAKEAATAAPPTKTTVAAENANVLKETSIAPERLPRKPPLEGLTATQRAVKSCKEKEKGNEAFRAGDHSEALLYYDRALAYNPADFNVINNRGLVYLKLEKWEKAIKDTSVVIEKEPSNQKALYRRAQAFKGRSQFSSAKTDIQRLLILDPSNKKAADLLDEIDSKLETTRSQGNKLVIEEVSSSEEDDDDEGGGGEECREVPLSEMPSLERQGPPPPSEQPCETAPPVVPTKEPPSTTKEFPTPSSATRCRYLRMADLPPACDLLNKQAGLSFAQGQYGDAADSYQRLADKLSFERDADAYRANLAIVWSNLAACRLKLGDCSGALQAADSSLSLVPNFWKSVLRRAQAHEMLESLAHMKSAYSDFSLAAALSPDQLAAKQGIERTSAFLRERVGAVKWREDVTHFRPADIDPSTIPIFLKPGEEEPMQESPPPISAPTPPASCPTPTSPSPPSPPSEDSTNRIPTYEDMKSKGNTFVAEGRLDDAIYCYTSAIEIDPQAAAPRLNRALCHLQNDKPQLALDDLEELLARPIESLSTAERSKCLYRKTFSLRKLDRNDEALACVKEAKAIDAQNPQICQLFNELIRWKKNENLLVSAKQTFLGNPSSMPCPQLPSSKPSGFEFWRSWNELKGLDTKNPANLVTYRDLVLQIQVDALVSVLSNQLNSSQLCLITKALCTHSEPSRVAPYLVELTKCPRFSTLLTFSGKDTQMIDALRTFVSTLSDSQLARDISSSYKL